MAERLMMSTYRSAVCLGVTRVVDSGLLGMGILILPSVIFQAPRLVALVSSGSQVSFLARHKPIAQRVS